MPVNRFSQILCFGAETEDNEKIQPVDATVQGDRPLGALGEHSGWDVLNGTGDT